MTDPRTHPRTEVGHPPNISARVRNFPRSIAVRTRKTTSKNLSTKSSGHQFVGASEFWGSGLGVSSFLSFFGRAACSCCAFSHCTYFGSSGLGCAVLGRPPIQVGIKSEIVSLARDFTSRRPSSRMPHPPKARATQRISARRGISRLCNMVEELEAEFGRVHGVCQEF